MEEVFKKVLEEAMKRWWIASGVVLFAVAVWLHTDASNWTDTKRFTSEAVSTLRERQWVLLGVGLAFCMYILWIKLVRMSHSRHVAASKRAGGPTEFSSKGNICNVYLMRKWDGKQQKYMFSIQLQNTLEKVLLLVEGRLRITSGGVRVAELPFAARDIGAKERVVASEEYGAEVPLLQGYDVFIEKAEWHGGSVVNEKQYGAVIVGHNFTWLFNLRLRRVFWPRKMRYDTYWLEHFLGHALLDNIRYRIFDRQAEYSNGRRVWTFRGALNAMGWALAIFFIALLATALICLVIYSVGLVIWTVAYACFQIAYSVLLRQFA